HSGDRAGIKLGLSRDGPLNEGQKCREGQDSNNAQSGRPATPQGCEVERSGCHSSLLGSLVSVFACAPPCPAWPARGASGQRCLDFLKHPVIGRFQMTVISIKSVVKDVLEKAGALATQNGIALYRLEIAIGGVRREDLHLPLAFGIVGVAVRINFSGEIVD